MIFLLSLQLSQSARITLWDRLHKSQSAREQARKVGLSIREAEWRLNAELFLDKYPRWEIEGPHWSIILYNMFLHTAEQGQKETERFI